MKHTKEPWEYRNATRVYGSDGEEVLQMEFTHIGKARMDARRIVACVNACAGITNEALENGIVMGCINIARIVNNPEVKKDSELRWMGVQVFEEDV